MISFSKRLELQFLSAIPSLLTLLLAIFYLVPKHIGGLSSVMPLLPLMPVFYWAMAHPQAIPYWFMFIIGLVMDAVMGMPLGLSSLLYIFFLSVINTQRKYFHKEGFLIKWGYLCILLLVTTGLNWLLLSWFHADAMPLIPAVIQWCLTIACYPVAHKLFDMLEHHIYDRRWQIMHG